MEDLKAQMARLLQIADDVRRDVSGLASAAAVTAEKMAHVQEEIKQIRERLKLLEDADRKTSAEIGNLRSNWKVISVIATAATTAVAWLASHWKSFFPLLLMTAISDALRGCI